MTELPQYGSSISIRCFYDFHSGSDAKGDRTRLQVKGDKTLAAVLHTRHRKGFPVTVK